MKDTYFKKQQFLEDLHFRTPLIEYNLLDWSGPSLKDSICWKVTFEWRWPSRKDELQCKMIIHGRQPSKNESFCNTKISGLLSAINQNGSLLYCQTYIFVVKSISLLSNLYICCQIYIFVVKPIQNRQTAALLSLAQLNFDFVLVSLWHCVLCMSCLLS